MAEAEEWKQIKEAQQAMEVVEQVVEEERMRLEVERMAVQLVAAGVVE